MAQNSEVTEGLAHRAMEVLAHMPPGSFTAHEFVTEAVGRGALDDAREIGAMLKYMIDNDEIRKLNTPIGQPARWIRCAHRGPT